MAPEQILSVQISYHSGWRAFVNSQPRRLYGDNLGQIAIEPRCVGPCTVEISYDEGMERILTWLSACAVAVGGVFWIAADALLRKRQS